MSWHEVGLSAAEATKVKGGRKIEAVNDKEKFLSGDSLSTGIQLGQCLNEVESMVRAFYRCTDENSYRLIIFEMKKRLRKAIQMLETMDFLVTRQDTKQ